MDANMTLVADQASIQAPGNFCWETITTDQQNQFRVIHCMLPDSTLKALAIRPVPPEVSWTDWPRRYQQNGSDTVPSLSPLNITSDAGTWYGYIFDGVMYEWTAERQSAAAKAASQA